MGVCERVPFHVAALDCTVVYRVVLPLPAMHANAGARRCAWVVAWVVQLERIGTHSLVQCVRACKHSRVRACVRASVRMSAYACV